MNPVQMPQAADLEHLRSLIGKDYVVTEAKALAAYGRDWTSLQGCPSVALLPGSTEEVAAVLAYCYQRGLAVVPNGGRTGLAGGAVAGPGEVVVALDRMNKILAVDSAGLSMRVEAGAITQNIQQAAREAGLFYAVDLAAKGSCQIGGNIATNAGGLKLIRYGGTREQILGLEVVLPDGRILDINYNLVKNNTGYDLKQLFIGSEGTLGIVTQATLKLSQIPKDLQLLCAALPDFSAITKLLALVNQRGLKPTAFEFFTDQALSIVLSAKAGCRQPFADRHPYYVLLECEKEAPTNGDSIIEDLCRIALEKELVADAVLAATSTEFRELWSLRELISESVAVTGHVRKNDIALPIASLPDFCRQLSSILKKAPQGITMVLFGHIGDGNLHLNYVGEKSMSFSDFSQKARAVEIEVFELCQSYRGSISAEHGIGLSKRDDLHFSRSDLEVDLMQKIKAIFDPKGLANPGKIFPERNHH